MKFGENLQYLRKQENMTQENLAQQLGIPCETVSVWEAGSSYPEMEQYLQLCDLFGCTMDGLMRGNMEETSQAELEAYDQEMNRFSKWVTVGAAILIAGTGFSRILEGIGVSEAISLSVFTLFVMVCVADFTIVGMRNANFRKKYPTIPGKYPKEEMDNYDRKFPVFIGTGIAVCIGGMALMQLLKGLGVVEDLTSGIFLMIDSIGTALVVYGALQKNKYNIEEYNKAHHPTEEEKRREKLDTILGAVFMIIFVTGLLVCYCLDALDKSWVMLLVAFLICIVVETVIFRNENNE